MKLALTIVNFLLALFLTVVVLLQEGKTSGMNSAVGGGSETFLSKNKTKTFEAKLARYTKAVAILFLLLTLVIYLMG